MPFSIPPGLSAPGWLNFMGVILTLVRGPGVEPGSSCTSPSSWGTEARTILSMPCLRNCSIRPRRSPFLCFHRLTLPVPDFIVQHPPAFIIRAVALSVQRTVSAVRGCCPVRHIAPEQRLVKIDVSHVNLLSDVTIVAPFPDVSIRAARLRNTRLLSRASSG